MPYKPVEEYELEFNIDRILRDPPVLRALTYLRVPNDYIAKVAGCAPLTVLSWRDGQRSLPDVAAERLIELAGCIIKDYEERWDSLQALEKEMDEAKGAPTHLCDKLLILLSQKVAGVSQKVAGDGGENLVFGGDWHISIGGLRWVAEEWRTANRGLPPMSRVL